ncbi:hypothetical protein J7T55_003540 [Diaporthe amygdali]|uniref:uncharacterized protein n=1 Tax=Phomopsis amygdali TaxID=1214568 RepID=UPI0022FF3D53|nr:uncharacterized protein J7T55_003540 [Diaporthe amygdali]KAJ0117123.1 hypothetical protein J7T55_003540 [Diaporthe amygdali]
MTSIWTASRAIVDHRGDRTNQPLFAHYCLSWAVDLDLDLDLALAQDPALTLTIILALARPPPSHSPHITISLSNPRSFISPSPPLRKTKPRPSLTGTADDRCLCAGCMLDQASPERRDLCRRLSTVTARVSALLCPALKSKQQQQQHCDRPRCLQRLSPVLSRSTVMVKVTVADRPSSPSQRDPEAWAYKQLEICISDLSARSARPPVLHTPAIL